MKAAKVALWGLGIVLAASVATGGDAKKDEAKLEGKWINELDGKKHEFTFTKGKFTVTFQGDEKFTGKGTYKIDGSKKPKQMDMKITEFPKEDFVGKTAKVIYDLDRDTLKWCANKPGEDSRPTAFPDKQGENGESLYLILKRAK